MSEYSTAPALDARAALAVLSGMHRFMPVRRRHKEAVDALMTLAADFDDLESWRAEVAAGEVLAVDLRRKNAALTRQGAALAEELADTKAALERVRGELARDQAELGYVRMELGNATHFGDIARAALAAAREKFALLDSHVEEAFGCLADVRLALSKKP